MIRAKLINAQQAHQALTTAYQELKPHLIAGQSFELTIKKSTRSTAQNRLMWQMLGEISEQKDWHGQFLTPSDWKTMSSAALKRQRVVPGIDAPGSFVVLGEPTSTMTVAEMTELIDFLSYFGASNGVRFSASPEMAETA